MHCGHWAKAALRKWRIARTIATAHLLEELIVEVYLDCSSAIHANHHIGGNRLQIKAAFNRQIDLILFKSAVRLISGEHGWKWVQNGGGFWFNPRSNESNRSTGILLTARPWICPLCDAGVITWV